VAKVALSAVATLATAAKLTNETARPSGLGLGVAFMFRPRSSAATGRAVQTPLRRGSALLVAGLLTNLPANLGTRNAYIMADVSNITIGSLCPRFMATDFLVEALLFRRGGVGTYILTDWNADSLARLRSA
jgi:hypothetical protein